MAEKLGLQPSQNHAWINAVLAQADKAIVRSDEEQVQAQRIEQFEAKLANKNEVIAELLEENFKACRRAANRNCRLIRLLRRLPLSIVFVAGFDLLDMGVAFRRG